MGYRSEGTTKDIRLWLCARGHLPLVGRRPSFVLRPLSRPENDDHPSPRARPSLAAEYCP
jgi:hypothetical protein